jgi:FAD/FMN-containing dehydrogenase
MEFAELILSYGGALTGTHGFMPREIQDKILRRELGDNEYELARKLKSAIDPNNIMNPKIRF